MSELEIIRDKIFHAIQQDSPSLLEKCFSEHEEKECKLVGKTEIVHQACAFQKVAVIKFLAQKAKTTDWVKEQFSMRGADKKTALHYALEGFRNKEDGSKVHHMNIDKFIEIVKIFTENGLSLECQDDNDATTLLIAAGSKKNLPGVKQLIKNGASYMVLNREGENLLHYSCKQTKSLDAVEECLALIPNLEDKIFLLQQRSTGKGKHLPRDLLSGGSTLVKGSDLDKFMNKLIEEQAEMIEELSATSGDKTEKKMDVENNASSKDLSKMRSKRPMKSAEEEEASVIIKKAKLGSSLGGGAASDTNLVLRENSSGVDGETTCILKPSKLDLSRSALLSLDEQETCEKSGADTPSGK